MAEAAITILPRCAKVTVRGRESTPALLAAAATALGFALPVAPNTATEGGGRVALWLAPGTWRIVGAPDEDGAALAAAFERTVARAFAGVVDVSDAYASFRIAGPQARATLARGCPLDLHERAFKPGQCAQSLLAKTEILLHQRDAAPTYDLQVRASHAAYLWAWLTGAPIEPSGILREPHNFL